MWIPFDKTFWTFCGYFVDTLWIPYFVGTLRIGCEYRLDTYLMATFRIPCGNLMDVSHGYLWIQFRYLIDTSRIPSGWHVDILCISCGCIPFWIRYGHLLDTCGYLTVIFLDTFEYVLDTLWIPCGYLLGSPWISYGDLVDILWIPCGYVPRAIFLLCKPCGHLMVGM